MRLDTNWILQEPIDLEHKQYVLLDYINKVDKDFEPKLIHTIRGVGYVLKENIRS